MIDSFSGRYHFLSNFHPLAGNITLEHLFQAAKMVRPEDKARIVAAETPGAAKRLGNKLQMRPDWDDVKLQVMYQLLQVKFQDPVLRHKLLATDAEYLMEGNRWHDTYWGVCIGGCKQPGGHIKGQVIGVGSNWLGVLLMQLRGTLRRDDDRAFLKSLEDKTVKFLKDYGVMP